MGFDETARFREHEIEWDDAKVARLWDYYSRTPPYNDLYVARRFGRRILQESGLPLGKPIDVLDFGCGPGFIWDHLLAAGSPWKYTAVDFSASSVAALAHRAQGHSLCAGVYHVTRLPTQLAAESFDAILLLEVVEHLKDEYLEATLTEMRRLLKKGGALVITTPNNENLAEVTRFCPECGAVFHQWQHVRAWDVTTLAAKLKQYGFGLRKYRALNFETTGIRRRLVQLAKTVIRAPKARPHLIAEFVRG